MEPITSVEELNNIFNYYKNADNSCFSYDTAVKEILGHYPAANYRLFNYLVDYRGYNALPQVVSDEDFRTSKSKIIFRGACDPEYNAQMVVDYDYHRGFGYLGSGIYGSHHRNVIFECYAKNEECLMTYKLDQDAKSIKRTKLSEILDAIEFRDEKSITEESLPIYHFVESLDENERYKFVEVLRRDISILAILLGYDVVKCDSSIICLNRGKMLISEREYKRILSNSNTYKEGVIDHQRKEIENGFLME